VLQGPSFAAVARKWRFSADPIGGTRDTLNPAGWVSAAVEFSADGLNR